jgi:sugar lactone lactonase YvrE
LDNSGNVYVADTANDTIRKITPGGSVTTLAGSPGQAGAVNGTGSAALFNGPQGVAVDSLGNVYVADTNNCVIRKITPDGVVTTLAGLMDPATNNRGSADGTGPSASFDNPTGLATDSTGNIYVADTWNSLIRMVSPSGVVTTLAGGGIAPAGSYLDGTGRAAEFYKPTGLAVDSAGNIYVADSDNNLIRKITPTLVGGVTTWVVTTLAGDYDAGVFGFPNDGTGTSARFLYPSSVAVDQAGNVYVADSGDDSIRKVTPAGVVTTLAGGDKGMVTGHFPTWDPTPGDADGTGSAVLFDDPVGVAIGALGNIYVADDGNNAIRYGYPNLDFTIQPQSETLNPGSTVVFTAAASDATGYQWELNGNPLTDSPGGTTSNAISGSTGPELMITNATAASAGNYTCIATDSGGTNTSSAANLVVASSANPGSLPNFSGRAFVGTGDNVFIGGFYIVGSTSRSVLIQALGPALAAQGVTETLQHPALSIHDSTGAVIYSNTGWGSSPVLLNAAAAAYAQPVLQPNSADSEILLTLPPGGYTAEISGADGGTGVALCAVYELP